MIENFENLKKQLFEIASVLNAFKSEAVQLRIVDLFFGRHTTEAPFTEDTETRRKPAKRRQLKTKQESDAATTRKKAPAGKGAVATLDQLLLGNFFDKPQTINGIIEHCKHNLARRFKPNELSGPLGRMVFDQELTRKKNADKQYEYKKP